MSKGGDATQRDCLASSKGAHEKQMNPVRVALRGGVLGFVLCRHLSHSLLGLRAYVRVRVCERRW